MCTSFLNGNADTLCESIRTVISSSFFFTHFSSPFQFCVNSGTDPNLEALASNYHHCQQFQMTPTLIDVWNNMKDKIRWKYQWEFLKLTSLICQRSNLVATRCYLTRNWRQFNRTHARHVIDSKLQTRWSN